MQKYFISGTDTGIGKTFAVGWLARRFAAQGKTVATQKLIQTGCVGISEDIVEHRRIMGVGLFPEDIDFTTCRYVLKYPASPHVVAMLEGVKFDIDSLNANTEKLCRKYDVVLVEGAGGLAVPISENFLMADYAKKYALPLWLVVPSKLGSLNHSLLSLEFCVQKSLELAGIIFNTYPKSPDEIENSTREYLKKYIAEKFPSAELLDMGELKFWELYI